MYMFKIHVKFDCEIWVTADQSFEFFNNEKVSGWQWLCFSHTCQMKKVCWTLLLRCAAAAQLPARLPGWLDTYSSTTSEGG